MKITTVEQLEALEEYTVIRDRRGDVGEIKEGYFVTTEPKYVSITDSPEEILPATLMIPATITQEQFDQAAKAAREAEWFGTGYEQAYAALTALGISVEEEDE